jgi:hypothetical protein
MVRHWIHLLLTLSLVHVGPALAQAYQVQWEEIKADPSTGATYAVGKGQALVGEGLVLTGGVLTSVSAETVTVEGTTLRIAKTTKVCARSGSRGGVNLLKQGQSIMVTSNIGADIALTIRLGSLRAKMDENLRMKLDTNYTCR